MSTPITDNPAASQRSDDLGPKVEALLAEINAGHAAVEVAAHEAGSIADLEALAASIAAAAAPSPTPEPPTVPQATADPRPPARPPAPGAALIAPPAVVAASPAPDVASLDEHLAQLTDSLLNAGPPIAPTPPPADLHPATHAEITHLANTMWAQGAPGGPLDHWLAAERQLLCK